MNEGLQMRPDLTEEEIKAAVIETYTAKAIESDECFPYCFSLHCARGTIPGAEAIGYIKEDLEQIPDEVLMGLGCGNPLVGITIKPGDTVVDLGSGSGIDVFLASKKVGEQGKVIGIDMTEEMVQKATKTAAHYSYDNVEFRMAEIEDLPIDNYTADVVISNCSVNLSLDKHRVFSEAFRALKPGGVLGLADVVVTRELSEETKKSIDAWTSCVAGALLKQEYLDTITMAGFENVEIIAEREFTDGNDSEKVLSITVKAQKPSN